MKRTALCLAIALSMVGIAPAQQPIFEFEDVEVLPVMSEWCRRDVRIRVIQNGYMVPDISDEAAMALTEFVEFECPEAVGITMLLDNNRFGGQVAGIGRIGGFSGTSRGLRPIPVREVYPEYGIETQSVRSRNVDTTPSETRNRTRLPVAKSVPDSKVDEDTTSKLTDLLAKRPAFCHSMAANWRALPTLTYNPSYRSPNEPAPISATQLSPGEDIQSAANNAASSAVEMLRFANQRADAYDAAAAAFWANFDRTGNYDPVLSSEYSYWIVARKIHADTTGNNLRTSGANGQIGGVLANMQTGRFAEPSRAPSAYTYDEVVGEYIQAIKEHDYRELSLCSVKTAMTDVELFDRIKFLNERIGYFSTASLVSSLVDDLSSNEKAQLYDHLTALMDAGQDVYVGTDDYVRKYIDDMRNGTKTYAAIFKNEADRYRYDLERRFYITYGFWGGSTRDRKYSRHFTIPLPALTSILRTDGRPRDNIKTPEFAACVIDRMDDAQRYIIENVARNFEDNLSRKTDMRRGYESCFGNDCLVKDAVTMAAVSCAENSPVEEISIADYVLQIYRAYNRYPEDWTN